MNIIYTFIAVLNNKINIFGDDIYYETKDTNE